MLPLLSVMGLLSSVRTGNFESKGQSKCKLLRPERSPVWVLAELSLCWLEQVANEACDPFVAMGGDGGSPVWRFPALPSPL